MEYSLKKRIYVAIGFIIYFIGIGIIYVRSGALIVLAAMLLTLGVLIGQIAEKIKDSTKKLIPRIISSIIYFAGIWIIYVRLGTLIVLAAMLLTLGVLIGQIAEKIKNNIKKFISRMISSTIYFTGIWIIYNRLGDPIVIAAMLLPLGILTAQIGEKKISNKENTANAQ